MTPINRPPDKFILESLRRRMLSSGKSYPTNKQLVQENVYQNSVVPSGAAGSGGGLMEGLGGSSPEPDSRYMIAPELQYNPLARNL